MASVAKSRRAVAPEREIFSGDIVKIAKKTRVFDDKRQHEGLDHIPEKDRPVLDVDVTGTEGQVQGPGYFSPRHGEMAVPIKTRTGALLAVPASRLKVTRTPTGRASFGYTGGGKRPSKKKFGSMMRSMMNALVPSFLRPKKR